MDCLQGTRIIVSRVRSRLWTASLMHRVDHVWLFEAVCSSCLSKLYEMFRTTHVHIYWCSISTCFRACTLRRKRILEARYISLWTGFMTVEERRLFDNLQSPHLKYWVPFVWFGNLAAKARKDGRIRDSIDLQTLMNVSKETQQKVLTNT